MKSLFIDTHDSYIVLGLFFNELLEDKEIKISIRHHSDFIMPMLDQLLKRNNITTHDLDEIIVVNGPGSFTGVRLGVIIAKMLTYTLNIPIKTITSLESIAVSFNSNQEKLAVIHDVKGVFASLFTSDNKIIGEMFYLENKDFDEYINKNNYKEIIIPEISLDLNKIYEYSKKIEPTLAHQVNPIYIKLIEVLKDDKKV